MVGGWLHHPKGGEHERNRRKRLMWRSCASRSPLSRRSAQDKCHRHFAPEPIGEKKYAHYFDATYLRIYCNDLSKTAKPPLGKVTVFKYFLKLLF